MSRRLCYTLLTTGIFLSASASNIRADDKTPGDGEVITVCGCEENATFVGEAVNGQCNGSCLCQPGFERFGGSCINKDLADFFKDQFGLDPEPIPPRPPRPGLRETKRPTELECAVRGVACTMRAASATEQCIMRETQFQSAFINDRQPPIPCHGQLRSDILEDLGVFNVPVSPNSPVSMPIACFEDWDQVLQQNEFQRSACINRFRQEAMRRCVEGVNPRSATETSGFNVKVAIPLGFADFGIGISGQTSFTTTRRAGIGIEGQCKDAGAQATRACNRKVDECNAKAKGAAFFVDTTPTDDELRKNFLLDRINRLALGLNEDQGPPFHTGIPLDSNKPELRSLSAGLDETQQQYIARLNFLVSWSNMIEKEDLNRDIVEKVHIALLNNQSLFSNDFHFLNNLVILLWSKKVGEIVFPSQDNQALARDYLERGGLGAKAAQRHNELHTDLAMILGPARTEQFMREVWPGTLDFAASRIFHPTRRQVLAPQ